MNTIDAHDKFFKTVFKDKENAIDSKLFLRIRKTP
jgi:hypothetical protein